MPSLISSLIIDPFVRQARRLTVGSEPEPEPRIPGSPQSFVPNFPKHVQVAESHANVCHDQNTNLAESNPHDSDDGREAGAVEGPTDDSFTTATNRQSRAGGDGVLGVDAGLSSCASIMTSKCSTPVAPLEPRRPYSEEPLVPSHSAVGPAPQTFQPAVSHTSQELESRDAISANPLHSSPDPVREIPPTTGRLLDTNMSRTAMPDHAKMASSLPADDGMRILRERIHGIRSGSVSQEEKARKMHDLMTEEWQNSQLSAPPQSPIGIISRERNIASVSPHSTACSPAPPQSTSSVPVDPQNPFNIHPEDLQPSYRPLPEPEPLPEDAIVDDSPTEDPDPPMGCKHYQRNVKIQCFDCKTWHTCRHCHDAAVSSHHLNRRATENMLCMKCWTPQAAGQYCKNCNERGAWYFCEICKLWDDDCSKRIYHCADCGICRRGEGIGKDFVHCKKCNVCISISHFPTHTCIENATASNCPLCLDYMFTSPLEVVAMPCGHYLHHHCYTSLMLSTYQCPICKRSAVNMETQWRKLEEEIRHQPMPREWAGVRVEVRCNDCAGKTIVPYHWLGCKCNRCDSFNTVEAGLLANEEVQRGVEDFAERRREIREEELRNRRPWTAPSEDQHHQSQHQPLRTRVVRPYFLDMEERDGVAVRSEHRRADSAGQFGAASGEGWAAQHWVNGVRDGWVGNVGGRWVGIGGRAEGWVGGVRDGFGLPALPNLPNLNPWEMLERVGRGLDPIRHYFDGEIVDGVPEAFLRATRLERERFGEDWGADDDADEEEEEDDSEFEDESGSESEDEGDDIHDDVDMRDVVTTPPIAGGKKGIGEASGVRELDTRLQK